MKFGIVDPRAARCEIIEAPDIPSAMTEIGLVRGQTDHDTIVSTAGGGIGMLSYEFGLFLPTSEQRYFSVGRMLIGGAALFYRFDAGGDTDNLEEMPPIVFYRDAHEVESMIRLGMIDRPQIKINDDIIWRWPDWPVEEGGIARMRGRGKL